MAAVSGGPDSMALLHVLSVLRSKLDFTLLAHGVFHGLRDGALAELQLAADWAHDHDIEFCTSSVDVAQGSNLQARARKARFECLQRHARQAGAVSIALGHHADDRAETVVMRLLRGAGPAGLCVMPSRAQNLIRPLISASRRDIMAHLCRHDVPYCLDPSNTDPRFLRARVRTEVMPLLTAMSPRIVEHLCDLAEDLQALRLGQTTLGRAQMRQLAAAAIKGDPFVRVALPGHRVARVNVRGQTIVIEHENDDNCLLSKSDT